MLTPQHHDDHDDDEDHHECSDSDVHNGLPLLDVGFVAGQTVVRMQFVLRVAQSNDPGARR